MDFDVSMEWNVGTSTHYDQQAGEDYFDFQASIGEFGGWANVTKFSDYVASGDTVLDFGCGGGYLLKNLTCARRIGVEVNPAAAEVARDNGVEVYLDTDEVPDGSIDVIVSNNALEHTLQPLDELKRLLPKLREGGRLVFVVPCESIHYEYKPKDINHHLYSWSPMCLGNLLTEAGYDLEESRPYIHKWPKRYRKVAKLFGRSGFELACRVKGRLDRKWFQVRAVARRNSVADDTRAAA